MKLLSCFFNFYINRSRYNFFVFKIVKTDLFVKYYYKILKIILKSNENNHMLGYNSWHCSINQIRKDKSTHFEFC